MHAWRHVINSSPSWCKWVPIGVYEFVSLVHFLSQTNYVSYHSSLFYQISSSFYQILGRPNDPKKMGLASLYTGTSNKLSKHYCSSSSGHSTVLMYFWSIPTPSCYPIPNSFSRDCILNSATTMADPPPVLFLWIGKGVANSSLDIVFPAGKSCTTQDQRRLNMIP